MADTAVEPKGPVVGGRRKIQLPLVDGFLWAIRIGAIALISGGLVQQPDQRSPERPAVAGSGGDRDCPGLDLRADRAGLHDGVRRSPLHQLRPWRGVHDRGDDRLLRLRRTVPNLRCGTANRTLPSCSPCCAAWPASAAVALDLERVAYRPLRNAPRLIPFITAIGASFFLQYAVRGLFGSDIKTYPDVPVLDGSFSLLGSVSRRSSWSSSWPPS